MPYALHPRVFSRIAELEQAGGDCSDFYWILERLRAARPVPERFSDHELRGKLSGLRSVIVGHTSEGRTVVMIYQLVKRKVAVAFVDEHDAAYDTLRKEKHAKRRRP